MITPYQEALHSDVEFIHPATLPAQAHPSVTVDSLAQTALVWRARAREHLAKESPITVTHLPNYQQTQRVKTASQFIMKRIFNKFRESK